MKLLFAAVVLSFAVTGCTALPKLETTQDPCGLDAIKSKTDILIAQNAALRDINKAYEAMLEDITSHPRTIETSKAILRHIPEVKDAAMRGLAVTQGKQ